MPAKALNKKTYITQSEKCQDCKYNTDCDNTSLDGSSCPTERKESSYNIKKYYKEGAEWYWKEMSYYIYCGTILDFNYDEYADGNVD